jgi:excisionase family DNA binding protein/putative nucleotidyltransferase with HDIG domain
MKKKFDEEIYFTPKQAAEYFNLSLSTVKNYIYAGKLKTLKTPGGHHRIRKGELLATLGDIFISEENKNRDDLFLIKICTGMLSVFKALGPIGNSLTLHSQNVSILSSDIAKVLAMAGVDIKRIEIAGLVHDIGLIAVEKQILFKSDILTSQEYKLLKNHPLAGEEILSSIKELKDIVDIVGQHHERLDGNGYPKGLKDKEILKAARIISIAEAYDSMTSAYSYKRPISKDEAITELMLCRGIQFDGEIVEVFTKII